MTHIPYSFTPEDAHRYIFTSVGKREIVKVVDFTSTTIKNLYSLSFGDLLSDGSIDDTANSNNGDILKILTTVVQITKDFTAQFPDVIIVFAGSTDERTMLYARILKMYFEYFGKDFKITAFIKTKDFYEEVNFDPKAAFEYSAFFIKRIV
jgi:hypothetical protein